MIHPMTSKPLKIIVDTDPGGDDTFALLWLMSLAKKGLAEIVAITTADGNVRPNYTFASASKILSLGGFDRVLLGRGIPHESSIGDAAHIHGVDGMGNLSPTLPASPHKFAEAPYSDEIIIDKLRAEPGEITLVTIAPLTNLAAAETKQPGILKQAKQIVTMAGAFNCRGNVTPVAEFNIAYNPEAAATFFAAREEIAVIPLDVTHKLIFTDKMADEIAQVNPEHDIAKFIHALAEFMIKTNLGYRETHGIKGFLVHDAATMAYLFYPETLLLRRAQVRIETKGEWTRGKTVMDDRHIPKTEPNAFVALQVDAANLLSILVEDLKSLISA